MALIARPHFGQHCHFNRIDFSDLWYLWPSRDTTNQSFFIGTDGRKEKGSTEKASVIQHWSTYSTTAPNFAPGLYHALLWLRSGESILLLVHFAPFPCYFGSSITCLMSPIWTIFEVVTVMSLITHANRYLSSDVYDLDIFLKAWRHSCKQIPQCMFPAFSHLDSTHTPPVLPSWLVSSGR